MAEKGRRYVRGILAIAVLTVSAYTAACSHSAPTQEPEPRNQAPEMAIAHAQPSANSGADSRGEQLFELHCAPCHVDQPQGLLKKPPNLSGVFSKPSLSSGAPATAAQVRKEIIEDIGTMPAFDGRLSDRDVQDLITYLRLLH